MQQLIAAAVSQRFYTYEAAVLLDPPSITLGIGGGRHRIGDSPNVHQKASMSLQLFAAALLGIGAVTPALGRDGSQVPLPNYADFCPDYALYSTYPQFVPAQMPSLVISSWHLALTKNAVVPLALARSPCLSSDPAHNAGRFNRTKSRGSSKK